MYAIVRTGGKQYRVEEGRSVDVELLRAEEGSRVEIDDVLLIGDDGDVTVGTPTIEGARVLADVEAHMRHKKIVVFKYRAKVRERKKTGHRQHFTRLAVTEILKPGQKPKAQPKRRAKKEEAEEVAAAADEEVTAKPPAAEAEATPKRAARKTDAKPKAEARTPTEDAEAEAKTAARKTPAKKKAAAKKPAAKKPSASKAKADDGDKETKKPAARKRPAAKKDDEE
jgi:ribosomal protein L21